MNTIALVLLLAFAPVARDRAWQDGILTDITKQNVDSTPASPDVLKGDRMSLKYVVYEFNIQTAERFYVADLGSGVISRGDPKIANPIDLGINAHVRFAIEKQALYIKDSHGKEYKLGIVKQGLRQ